MLFKSFLLVILLKVNISTLALDWSQNHLKDNVPKVASGNKEFVLGFFFEANWYRASQFCHYHNMRLASFSTAEEYESVVNLINAFGLSEKDFWISGNDLASQGNFFWMGNGQPLTYTSWFTGEPNNIGSERCIEISNGIYNDRKNVTANQLRWNNSFCNDNQFFICERYL